jgi:hypothetical protein
VPTSATAKPQGRSSILEGYSALPGVPDELLRDDGTVRPEWVSLIVIWTG